MCEINGQNVLGQGFAFSFEQAMPRFCSLELILHSTQGLSGWEDSFPILTRFICLVKLLYAGLRASIAYPSS